MPHVIDSITPNHGLTGTVVVIAGSGFGAVQGASTVDFNGTLVVPTIWSDTALTVTVPASTTGPVHVVVGGLQATAPTHADFFRYEATAFPAGLDDFTFQNEQDDSGPPDDLLIADARDLNQVLELLLAIQKKVGIDGSLDATSLDNLVNERALALRGLAADVFETVPGGANPIPTGVTLGLHRLQQFPDGSTAELLTRFRVPPNVKAGSSLDVRPVFVLSTAPGGADNVVLNVYGEAGTTTIASSPTVYPVGAFGAGAFVVGPTLRSIPVATAPANMPVALRFSRLGAHASDNYTGSFRLDYLLVEYEV